MADEWEVPPSGEAQALLSNHTLQELTQHLIGEAKDALTRINPNDAATVARFQGEVAGIESLLRELEVRAAGKATS